MLEAAPDAKLVTNFFSFERLNLEPEWALPLERMVWLDPGSSLDIGDRRLHLFRPPIFDGPTTRGVFDDRSGVMWAVDSFAAGTPGAVYEAGDVPADLYAESFDGYNSSISPWHAWLDQRIYRNHVDLVEAFAANAIASAHGAVLTGRFIADAFDLTVRGERLHMADSSAVAETTRRGVHVVPFCGIPPTGRTIELRVAVMFEFRSGLVAGKRFNGDRAPLAEQLDVDPSTLRPDRAAVVAS